MDPYYDPRPVSAKIKPHKVSDDDLTILECRRCGWRSEEQTRAQMKERGIPWYCDNCDAKGLNFITFHPTERAIALDMLGPLRPPL